MIWEFIIVTSSITYAIILLYIGYRFGKKIAYCSTAIMLYEDGYFDRLHKQRLKELRKHFK